MRRLQGIAMIVVGSILWGASGPMMEWILGETNISVPFLLTIRLIVSGLIILAFLFISKKEIFAIWKSPSARIQLIVFSILGVLGLQYTFIAAIAESDAVLATLLQFSAPIIITIYVSLKFKILPPKNQVIGIVGTLIGLFLLLTNGSIDTLLISNKALILGLGVGLAFAFYTLYPARLMVDWSILVILGWGMFLGGIIIGGATQAWNSNEWHYLAQPNIAFLTITFIIFGTVAYFLFLSSLKYISPVETSILSSIEPLTAMIISVIWFGTILESIQLVGALLMLIFVTLLSIGGKKT